MCIVHLARTELVCSHHKDWSKIHWRKEKTIIKIQRKRLLVKADGWVEKAQCSALREAKAAGHQTNQATQSQINLASMSDLHPKSKKHWHFLLSSCWQITKNLVKSACWMYGVRYCPDNLENILVIRKGESQVLCSGREVAGSRDQSSHKPHITRGTVGLSRARYPT